MSKFKTIIGLEVHAQLDTKSKMFCECDNMSEGAEPNTNVCEICMGHPGTLPVANKQAIDWTVLTGLALNCEIPEMSKFDRKNYFYPDLPKGYQISQYDKPFCVNGGVTIEVDGKKKTVQLDRIHLEEDAAKNTHPGNAPYSLVDFNRAGTPLMEIVSKPDIETPEQARLYLQELQKVLRYLGVSRADMEKGHMRCDANISIEREDGQSSGIVEIKNMNSFRSVERSLTYEEKRLSDLLADGEWQDGKTTRGWDDGKGETFLMRTKEEAADYRYFPEPDIPPFTFDEGDVNEIRRGLPELPTAKRERFMEEYGLSEDDAVILVGDKDRASFFENVVGECMEWARSKSYKEDDEKKLIKMATNYLLSELLKHVKEKELSFADIEVSPENFAELVTMTKEGQINSSAAQKVLEIMIEKGGDPSEIVENQNLGQTSDEGEIESIVDAVITEHEGPANDYRGGKENALQFLVGMVMKASQGKANPAMAKEMLEKKLKE